MSNSGNVYLIWHIWIVPVHLDAIKLRATSKGEGYSSNKTDRDIFSHNAFPATAYLLLSGEITDGGEKEWCCFLFTQVLLPPLSLPPLSTCALLSLSCSTIIIYPSAVIKLSLFPPLLRLLFLTLQRPHSYHLSFDFALSSFLILILSPLYPFLTTLPSITASWSFPSSSLSPTFLLPSLQLSSLLLLVLPAGLQQAVIDQLNRRR